MFGPIVSIVRSGRRRRSWYQSPKKERATVVLEQDLVAANLAGSSVASGTAEEVTVNMAYSVPARPVAATDVDLPFANQKTGTRADDSAEETTVHKMCCLIRCPASPLGTQSRGSHR